MSLGFLYYFLLLLSLLFGFWGGYRTDPAGRFPIWGSSLILFLLFLLLGLKIWGSPIQGG